MLDTRIKAVTFDEEKHKYFYNGVELHGVTGAIGKLMGKSFPDTDIVKLATIYGSDVHKEVENYYNGDGKLSSEGAKWVVEELSRKADEWLSDRVEDIKCEVMVSDFEGTASKVDVVMRTFNGNVWLFDIKTTSKFDRAYCSLQLSVYKELYEKCYGGTVCRLFVLGVKSKRTFRILDQGKEKVQKILDMNRVN
jgi:hypothetical protein